MATNSSRSSSGNRSALEQRLCHYLAERAAFYAHADLRESETKRMKHPCAVKADGRKFDGATRALLRSVAQCRSTTRSTVLAACRHWAHAYRAKLKDSVRMQKKKWWSQRDYASSAAKMKSLYAAEQGLYDAMQMAPTSRDPLNDAHVRTIITSS